MVRSLLCKSSKGYAAIFGGALATVALVVVPNPAHAGFFDFLFGGAQQQRAPQPDVNSYATPSAPVAPAPLGPESVRQSDTGTGHVVAFCVRLCDGESFPLESLANSTPIETCRSMCPASKTKVFFGSGIDHAVARDGARYTDLENAYVYRQHLVPNCTCNGKDAFGLAPFDLTSDPTLRPGDIVATKNGFVAYTGKGGRDGGFSPVDSSAIAAELNGKSSRVELTESGNPPLYDDAGTIVHPPATLQGSPPVVDPRGQSAR